MSSQKKKLARLIGRVDALGRDLMAINDNQEGPSEVHPSISDRTKAVLREKRRQGEYCGGHIPYGYMKTLDGQKLVPDPVEQSLIRTVQGLVHDGVPYREIADALEHAGWFTRRGTKFQPGQIARLAAKIPATLG